MNKLKQELYLLSLALEADEGKIKQLYAENKLTAEQYIEVTEMINSKTAEELSERSKLVNDMILEIEAKKIAERQARSDKLNQLKTKGLNSIKSVSDSANSIDPHKTKKVGVVALLVIAGIIVLSGVGIGGKYVYENYFGYTKIDLTDYIIPTYDTDGMTASPDVDWIWEYYDDLQYEYLSENPDIVSELTSEGYAKEDIDKLDEMSYNFEPLSYIVENSDIEYSTSQELGNGDQFEITIPYDQEVAKEYKFKITNNVGSFTMTGLQEQVTPDDVTAEMISQLEYTNDQLTEASKKLQGEGYYSGETYEILNQTQFLTPGNDSDYGWNPAKLTKLLEVKEKNPKTSNHPEESVVPMVINVYGNFSKTDKETTFYSDSTYDELDDSQAMFYIERNDRADYDQRIQDYIDSGAIQLDSQGNALKGQVNSEISSEQ